MALKRLDTLTPVIFYLWLKAYTTNIILEYGPDFAVFGCKYKKGGIDLKRGRVDYSHVGA